MARQRVEDEVAAGQTQATPGVPAGGASGAPQEEDANRPALVQSDGRVVASAVPADAPKSPEMKRYRVLNNTPILTAGGHRTVLRAGKVISELNYDVATLKRQGVQVELLPPGEF